MTETFEDLGRAAVDLGDKADAYAGCSLNQQLGKAWAWAHLVMDQNDEWIAPQLARQIEAHGETSIPDDFVRGFEARRNEKPLPRR